MRSRQTSQLDSRLDGDTMQFKNHNQGGDKPSWMFKEDFNREKTKNRDSKKKPAQFKKSNNHATQDVKVQEGTTEGNCVAGPVLTRSQVKKSYKIHQLKLKKLCQVSKVYHRKSSEEGFYSEEML